MVRFRVFGRLVAALLVTLSACSGGSGSGDPASDLARAEKVNLQAADFPAGWSSRPHEELPGEPALRPDIARCLGLKPMGERTTAQAVSEDFTQNMATAYSVVTFVASADEVRADAAAFASGRFADCAKTGYGAQIQAVAPEGNSLLELSVMKVEETGLGDNAVAHRVGAVIQFGPITVPITIDLVHIFEGRAEIELTVVSPGAPFEREFIAGLAESLIDRL